MPSRISNLADTPFDKACFRSPDFKTGYVLLDSSHCSGESPSDKKNLSGYVEQKTEDDCANFEFAVVINKRGGGGHRHNFLHLFLSKQGRGIKVR